MRAYFIKRIPSEPKLKHPQWWLDLLEEEKKMLVKNMEYFLKKRKENEN